MRAVPACQRGQNAQKGKARKKHYVLPSLPSIFNYFMFYVGGNLLSHTLPGAVPSARAGLASGFGMDIRAFPCRYGHRQIIGTISVLILMGVVSDTA